MARRRKKPEPPPAAPRKPLPECGSCRDPCEPYRVDQLPKKVREVMLARGRKPEENLLIEIDGKARCFECMAELTTGRIPPAWMITGVPADGATTGHPATADDDNGPWGENAVRHLEGD